VRETVSAALAKIRSKAYVNLLLEASENEKDEYSMKIIVNSLEMQRDKMAIPRLIELLGHESEIVVDAAMTALYEIVGEKFATSLEWKSWWEKQKKPKKK